jgi:hypothetical protein
MRYASVPPSASEAKSYATWSRDLGRWLADERPLRLLRSPRLAALSRPAESERDFRIRLRELARERRDGESERLRAEYAGKRARLADKLQRTQQAEERERGQAQAQMVQTAVSFGSVLLNAFLGRKRISAATLGRATTGARGVGRVMKERGDVDRAAETVAAVQSQITALEEELQTQLAAMSEEGAAAEEALEAVEVRAKKAGIDVRLVALAWVPG